MTLYQDLHQRQKHYPMATQQNSNSRKKSGKARKQTITNNPRYINKFLTDDTGRKHTTWKEYTRAQARPNRIRVEKENRERNERNASRALRHLRELEQDKAFNSSHPMRINDKATVWSHIEIGFRY